MSRRKKKIEREIILDPKFNSELVSRMVNAMMRGGKKTTAERIVYGAIAEVEAKKLNKEEETLEVVSKAVNNMKPRVEVKSRRVGGATYQVPVEVKPACATTLTLRWLTDFSRARREKTMAERLANEILDASNGLGASVKRREDTHKMAEANRAFAHYRW
jgi:small subunit ribosomal protein S7